MLHSTRPPLDAREFSDDLGRLAVDLERWQKEFNGLVFPSMVPANGKKSAREMRAEGKTLGQRCFKAAGKLDALVHMDDAHATNGLLGRLSRHHRSPSNTTVRTHTRTPSPVPSAGMSIAPFGGVSRSSSPPCPHVYSPQPERIGRGAGVVGVA